MGKLKYPCEQNSFQRQLKKRKTALILDAVLTLFPQIETVFFRRDAMCDLVPFLYFKKRKKKQ